MAVGPFGGPRPLLNITCDLLIKHFAGGIEKSSAFSQEILEQFKVAEITLEREGPFPQTLVADIRGNRTTLSEFDSFLESYSDTIRTPRDEIEIIIESRVDRANLIDRPFATVTVQPAILIEVSFPPNLTIQEVNELSSDVVQKVEFITEFTGVTQNDVIFETRSDSMIMDNVDTIRQVFVREDIPPESIVIACGVEEF